MVCAYRAAYRVSTRGADAKSAAYKYLVGAERRGFKDSTGSSVAVKYVKASPNSFNEIGLAIFFSISYQLYFSEYKQLAGDDLVFAVVE